MELTSQLRRKLRKKAEKLNRNGEKVIAFAYKGLPKKKLQHYEESFVENDLVFIGMIGLGNPLNRDIMDSVKRAKQSGLKIFIMTKLRERKAAFCASEFGITNQNYFEIINGNYLESLNNQKIRKMLSNRKKDFVFSGLKEGQKILIMKILKSMGETVALTSREEKDPFATIVDSIEKKKKIIANFPKIFAHGMSCKIAEMILALTVIFLDAPFAFSLTMIIVLDILINLILELSLRMNEIKDPPQKHLAYMLTNGLSIGLILLGTFFFNLLRYGWDLTKKSTELGHPGLAKSITITFVTLILIQIISAFFLRDQKKSIFKITPLSNVYLALTALITLLLLYALMIIGPLKNLFGLAKLSALDWQIIGFALGGFVIIEEVRKLITNHQKINE